MARRRTGGVELPEGVQCVRKANGKRYYYWAPHRNTPRAEKPIPLGSDATEPGFWTRVRALCGLTVVKDAGTFNALIREYRASAAWSHLRPRSRDDYGKYLDRIAAAAGERRVDALTKRDLYQWRDSLQATPVLANHLLSIMRTLLEFAVERGYREDNPGIGVRPLKSEVNGAKPWPEEGWEYVGKYAPADIRRMAMLGRASGQRISDLVRMRPADRHLDGINVRIQKLRGKQHFVPLTQAEIVEIDSWKVGPLDLYLKSVKNRPYTQGSMNTRWNLWKARQPAIAGLEMKIHGLRATAVCDRRMAGMTHQEISAELCMSMQMVMRYSRWIDQEALARASRSRREGNVRKLGG